MAGQSIEPQDGALPFSDVTGLLSAAATAEKQQALVARIFLPQSTDPSSSASVDHFAQLSAVAKELKQFIRRQTRSADSLAGQDYIWHREPPSVSIQGSPLASKASASSSREQLPPHVLFHLRTGGECIEDEWFATHLLLRASVQLSQHQLCISVEDEDGQFLLIEAAEYLPEWVTPETVVNRVWIHQGHLHLISPHHRSSDDGTISVSHAIALIADATMVTCASDDIEAAAFARAYDFPSAAIPHHHTTLAYLPRKIARVLAADPQLIANCVTSIQSQDVVSSRSGSRLIHFPPRPSQPSHSSAAKASAADDNEIVLTPVRMTRHLYAQLLYDRFFPPRQLGQQWQAAVEKYRLRLHRQQTDSSTTVKIEDEEKVQTETLHGRWHDLGAKIWCGLEMAYTDALSRRMKSKGRPMMEADVPIDTQERQELMASLTKLGYFQGEIEGSAKWKELEAEAFLQYQKGTTSMPADVDDDDQKNTICDAVDRILKTSSELAFIKAFTPDTPLDTLKAQEDDDSWLQLNPEDIDSILGNRSGSAEGAKRVVNEQDTFERLGAFNTKIEDFLKTKSDVHGALFDDELDADEIIEDEDLLFEDVDEEEQEQRVRAEVERRMRSNGEDEKRKLVDRLLPRMLEQEWTRKSQPPAQMDVDNDQSQENFSFAIDRIAAGRSANAPTVVEEREVAPRLDPHLSAAQAELRRRLASQYMRETSSKTTQLYDGASDSDCDELEQETSPEVRRQRAAEYEIEPDEPAPTVEGDVWEDVPEEAMQDEETEIGNLLEFARISLGLSKEQYEAILAQRQADGKFVPTAQRPKEESKAKVEQAETPAKLDTFESVMAAMDSQLDRLQSTQPSDPPDPSTMHPKLGPDADDDDEDDPEDAELLAHLLRSNSDLPSSLLSDPTSIHPDQLESFLRSFAAQSSTTGPNAGSGPVESLMRRFGLGSLPANSDS